MFPMPDFALGLERRGGITAVRINRRALLVHSGAVVFASTVVTTASAVESSRRDRAPPNKMRIPIEPRVAAYAAIGGPFTR